jgi:ABC-type Mn2+/Zn2+ transport system ATPase subunit
LAHFAHHILRLDRVTVRHGRVLALENVSAAIPCGGATVVVGPNGAGKSTLLRAILGWHPLADGEIRIGDTHTHHALPRFAYLPQAHAVDWDFPVTVREVVEQGRWPALRPWARLGAADRAAVDRAMAELEITALAKRPLQALSGGQRQRVFLARALAQGADVFLLDEPFNGLDRRATAELTHILLAWRAQGRTVVAAVHDLTLAREHFEHALVLATRLVAAGPVATTLTEAHFEVAFGAVGEGCAHAGGAGEAVPVPRTGVFPS